MQEIRISSILNVYHDGQFWVGVFERTENGMLSVCRIVFGAEPANEEIQQLICTRWNRLSFSKPLYTHIPVTIPSNPKRRQREAARTLKRGSSSTKAQLALSQEREAATQQHKAAMRKHRNLKKQQQFELRHKKRKQKHRGK